MSEQRVDATEVDSGARVDERGRRRDEPASAGAGCEAALDERRRCSSPASLRACLQQLPALVLLDRLATPTLAVGDDGTLVYLNPAFAALVGVPDGTEVTEVSLPPLIAGHAGSSPLECMAVLRAAAGTVVTWVHLDGGYPLYTVVSPALLTRATDPLLVITLTDITDIWWER